MREKSIDEQLAYLRQGTAEIISEPELRERLVQSQKTGKPLRVKLGVDPTAPDIHLGHTVVLRKMRHFQDLGHTVIFLIGDFTGMVGDPSGRSVTRPQLTQEEIERNAETYKQQVHKVLDPARTELRFNSEWLGKFAAQDLLKLCSHYTVARLIERDDFSKRLKENQPIALHELFYPMLQAYDSVALEADVEQGGTDQKFNLMVGRDIQRAYGQPPQIAVLSPILPGLDGVQRMSKSLGNYVGVTEPPAEMFGKLMSISDDLMWQYYELLTDIEPEDLAQFRLNVESAKVHPIDAKSQLATIVVTDFHGPKAAAEARAHFDHTIRKGETPRDLQPKLIPIEKIGGRHNKGHYFLKLDKVLRELGWVPSASEATRKVKEGSVYVDGEKKTEVAYPLRSTQRQVLIEFSRHAAIIIPELSA
jgi:tyrosyl-tRNA synthetase